MIKLSQGVLAGFPRLRFHPNGPLSHLRVHLYLSRRAEDQHLSRLPASTELRELCSAYALQLADATLNV